jgi:putative FmdB family regulatory protein
MPLYVYASRDCGETFEMLVTPGETPACRACDSDKLNQQISLIATPRRGGETAPAMASCAAGDMCCCACDIADG